MNQHFQASVAEFRKFLASNGYSQEIIWIRPDDVVFAEGSLYVRVPVPQKNEECARKLFERSILEQNGLLFGTLCEIDGATYSYVWLPKDKTESQEALMPRGIKMSVAGGNSRIRGKAVRNRVHWCYLRIKYRKKQKLKKQLFQ